MPTTSWRPSTRAGPNGTSSRSSTRSSRTASHPRGLGVEPPEWAVLREWDELSERTKARDAGRVVRRRPRRGIAERLDHIAVARGEHPLSDTRLPGAAARIATTPPRSIRSTPCSAGTNRSRRARPRCACARDLGDRRPHHQPRAAGARVVHRCPGSTVSRSAEFFYFDDALRGRLRVLVRRAHAAEARLRVRRSSASACTPDRRRWCAAGWSRRSTSTAGGSTSRT